MLFALTVIHVLLSLIGIATGLLFLKDLLRSRLRGPWTNTFLITTIATSVTGYFFPVDRIMPGHIVGAISLAALALALYAMGKPAWRNAFIASTLAALYLNVFVLVVQMFLKIEPLRALAPTQTELPFQLTQAIVLLLFCLAGFRSLRAGNGAGAALPQA